MKMMNQLMIALVVLVLNACSTNDSVALEEQQETTIETKTSEEEVPYAYLEELHYMYLLTAFGEEHELVPIYRERFEEVAAGVKPGSGCPKPQPCDYVGNCKAFFYPQLEGLINFGTMEGVNIDIFNSNGQLINGVSNAQVIKCPTKSSFLHEFEEPLQGNGYFRINFASELTGGEMVEFEVPFFQE